MRYSRIIFLLFIAINLHAQEKKSVETLNITTPLTIDGILNEPFYQQAIPAKDFVQLQPYNGKPSFQPSEVYFFYDQTAIYVGAMLYDSAPDSIFTLLTSRDNIGMSDYFGVYLDPYNEGQLAYGFFITPAGVQTDIKAVKSDGDYEDGNWDAVWESKTQITKNGWIVEMRIPYSALRFPEKDIHIWGLNMFRNIRRYNSNNSWNLVDRKVSGFIHQEGQMTNIKNIKPPVRLSFSPYAATYLEYKDGSSKPDFVYKGGMDVKYGLSESFTLDMMLVPDFGQIQSDDKQLNLSPYEIYFDEKRQFFNEGTELFQRGGIFYSRRIGANPKFGATTNTNEIVDFMPGETQLVNATKISGRTSKGLGLGILNAMSLPSYATIKDTITGNKREVQVQPFTNYNISVIDKTLKNNGYLSIINSNMYMVNNPFMANVIATEFQIRDKSKTYAIKGKGGFSSRGASEKENGYFAGLGIEKNGGNLNFGITQQIYSDKFNPNDLGYLRRNNEVSTQSYLYYKVIEPFWIIREWSIYNWWNYNRIFNPSDVYSHDLGFELYVLFKNNYYIDINGGGETNKHEYYETRVQGRYWFAPYYYYINYNFRSDQRKPLNFYVHYGGFVQPNTNQTGYWGDGNLNLRVGQRLQIGYSFSFHNEINDRGYVDKTSANDSIWFAIRNLKTFENVLEASFAISNKASLNIRTRHYWSGARNKNFHLLQNDGTLVQDMNYNKNKDENYNAFNIDLGFRWIFAPGSELTLAWKNSIYNQNNEFNANYNKNLDLIMHSKQTNTFSFKILYYIDYNRLRRKK